MRTAITLLADQETTTTTGGRAPDTTLGSDDSLAYSPTYVRLIVKENEARKKENEALKRELAERDKMLQTAFLREDKLERKLWRRTTSERIAWTAFVALDIIVWAAWIFGSKYGG